ncbi:MAG: MBL fold metallo-hydrolase [Thermodesulfobacteriota bacterium]
MAKTEQLDEITGCSDKATLLGNSIPVWVYLVDGLLVDAGPYSLRRQFMQFFRKSRIEQVAVTHTHEDHCGLAASLQREKQVPVYVPAASVKETYSKGRVPVYRRMIWGRRPAFESREMPEYVETNRFRFLPVFSPGHCKQHLAFLEEERGWLFTGDVYVRKNPVVAITDENMNELIKTLRYLLKFDFQTVFCSHAGILQNGREALSAKLEYLLEKREMVQDMRKQGKSEREMEQAIYPGRLPIELVSRGEWSRRNIVNTLA